jgi:hypothetical protein
VPWYFVSGFVRREPNSLHKYASKSNPAERHVLFCRELLEASNHSSDGLSSKNPLSRTVPSALSRYWEVLRATSIQQFAGVQDEVQALDV